MYLRGSSWKIKRNHRRSNPFRILILSLLVAAVIYINQAIVPNIPPLFVPTPTPTRSLESYLYEAEGLIKEGKFNQAIIIYKEAVRDAPHNPVVFVTLAQWQVLVGDLEDAKENVQNAILINPNLAIARAIHGWILVKEKMYLDAERELQIAIELDPNSALAYAFMAELNVDKLSTNQADLYTQQRAIDFSQMALSLNPSLMEVHRIRGLVLENTAQPEEAIKEFEAAVKIAPNLSELWVNLGRNYRLVGKYYQAIEALDRAISLRPDDPNPYSELAATYLTSGEFSKGEQIASQAIERDPNDPFLYGLQGTMFYKLAYVKEQLGQVDEAHLLYQQALSLLRISVKGGINKDNGQVNPLPLNLDDNASIYYRLRYGLAQAKLGNCVETLSMVQELRQGVIGNENVNSNIDTMLQVCKQEIDEGIETPMPTTTE